MAVARLCSLTSCGKSLMETHVLRFPLLFVSLTDHFMRRLTALNKDTYFSVLQIILKHDYMSEIHRNATV